MYQAALPAAKWGSRPEGSRAPRTRRRSQRRRRRARSDPSSRGGAAGRSPERGAGRRRSCRTIPQSPRWCGDVRPYGHAWIPYVMNRMAPLGRPQPSCITRASDVNLILRCCPFECSAPEESTARLVLAYGTGTLGAAPAPRASSHCESTPVTRARRFPSPLMASGRGVRHPLGRPAWTAPLGSRLAA